jgi:hypothetical protein
MELIETYGADKYTAMDLIDKYGTAMDRYGTAMNLIDRCGGVHDHCMCTLLLHPVCFVLLR